MPFPEDLLPHTPSEGPPVPKFLPGWPVTPEDVDRAVYHYRESMFRAAENFRRSLPMAVEKYRLSLMRRLP